MNLTVSIVIGMTLCIGCAHTPRNARSDGGESEARAFALAVESAVEAKDVELPRRAKTLADIRLITRAHDVALACVPGKSPAYSAAWLAENRERVVHTSSGDRTVGALAQTCREVLDEIESRSIEACGARYVQLEQTLGEDDTWGAPRVAKTSDGWYMTPCDRLPGQPAGRDLKEVAGPIHSACEDEKAHLYVLAHWSEPKGGRKTETVACLSARQDRSGWLPGNPGLLAH